MEAPSRPVDSPPAVPTGVATRHGRPRPPAAAASGRFARWQVAAVCISLSAMVWLVFGPTLRYGFVNVDDGVYVYQNRLITAGLTRVGIARFLGHAYGDYWAPLLAISHMVDCQLFGLWPGGHHLTNVVLFNATVLLLFVVLRQLTGALWRSAFVAAAWAVHPLRAESVAWVTERKDTLSGLFLMLTLMAYVRYVQRPSSWARYVAVSVLFACALMSKPLVVTLPCVLLLLDYWPLRRAEAGGFAAWKPLCIEKIPLFLLSAALCVITAFTASHTLMPAQQAPYAVRAENAVVSTVTYLGQTFYPVRLAAFYPYPSHLAPIAEVVLGLVLLAMITVAALAWRKTQPWLLVGWFWYLGMLVPMIGLVQSGEQAQADRFTFLPQIGFLLALTWTAWHWSKTLRLGRFLPAGAAAMALAALLVCARLQASYWQDSVTLWRHALACTSRNNFAQNNLGVALLELGRRDEAAAHFQAAIQIQPRHVQAQFNLANLLLHEGQTDRAIDHYEKALAVEPGYFDALNNLGIALASEGRIDEAALAYQRALGVRPASAEIHDNLGHALLGSGRAAEAIRQFQQAVDLAPAETNGYDGLGGALLLANRLAEAALCYQKALARAPTDETALNGLGSANFLQGRWAEAVANWRKALLLDPAKSSTLNNLAWLLATGPADQRNGAEAVRMAESAAKLTGGTNPVIWQTLAAAYAEAGRFPEARAAAETALKLAAAPSNRALAARIESELQQYDAGQPYHMPGADIPESR